MNDNNGRKRTFALMPAAVIAASMLILSIAVFPSAMQGQTVLADGDNDNHRGDIDRTVQRTANTDALPQPNDEKKVLTAEATNAVFQPAAGLSNVFGPGGLFPFENVFDCADSLECGVSAGDNAKFVGVFEEGNENELTGYEATYTSPITYGDQQMEGHQYKIELTDLKWNSSDAAMPTRQPEFAQMVNNVGLDQIQHGSSHIDRSDVPQLKVAFLYGHAKVTDLTEDRVVAEDIFTHVMVGHIMDEDAFYRSMKDLPASPDLVLLFAVNIPNDTELPGVGQLSAEQAQSFTPLPEDVSLDNPPPVDYPVEIPAPRQGTIDEPEPQSTTWPVANPEQPLFFTFLVYQDTEVKLTTIDDIVGDNYDNNKKEQ